MRTITHCRLRRKGGRAGVAVAVIGMLALLVTSCTSSHKVPSNPSGGGKPATDVTIGIDVPFHPLWDYLEAKSSLYFKGKPYTVHFKVLDATTQVPAFGRGDIQVMTTVPSFMPIVKQQYGIDTKYFFPLARWTTGPQILVKKGSPYKSLADLKGKTVAIPPLSSRFGAEQAAILAATGEKIQDYFNLQQTEAAPQQLALGRVDAAFIEAPTTLPLLQTGNFTSIYSVHDAFQKEYQDPAVLNGGYIASDSFIKNNPGFIAALVRATQDIWQKYQADPNAVNEVASKVSGVPVAQLEVVGQVLDLTNIPAAERAVTQRDVDTWTKLYPVLQKAGFIKQAPTDPSSLLLLTSDLPKGS